MRPWAALALILALSGCVAEFLQSGTPGRARALGYSFDSGGIEQAQTALRIDFGRAQDGAIESASRLFGALPDQLVQQNGCDGGRQVESARWPGVSLTFLGGSLRGWVIEAPGLPANGLSVGMDRADLPPETRFTTTALGSEFTLAGINGIILPGQTEVAQLWSGVACFYR